MKRNAAVLLVLVAVLVILLWAGWHNYERRKLAALQANENQPMQVTLVPAAPGDSSAPAADSSANPTAKTA